MYDAEGDIGYFIGGIFGAIFYIGYMATKASLYNAPRFVLRGLSNIFFRTSRLIGTVSHSVMSYPKWLLSDKCKYMSYEIFYNLGRLYAKIDRSFYFFNRICNSYQIKECSTVTTWSMTYVKDTILGYGIKTHELHETEINELSGHLSIVISKMKELTELMKDENEETKKGAIALARLLFSTNGKNLNTLVENLNKNNKKARLVNRSNISIGFTKGHYIVLPEISEQEIEKLIDVMKAVSIKIGTVVDFNSISSDNIKGVKFDESLTKEPNVKIFDNAVHNDNVIFETKLNTSSVEDKPNQQKQEQQQQQLQPQQQQLQQRQQQQRQPQQQQQQQQQYQQQYYQQQQQQRQQQRQQQQRQPQQQQQQYQQQYYQQQQPQQQQRQQQRQQQYQQPQQYYQQQGRLPGGRGSFPKSNKRKLTNRKYKKNRKTMRSRR